MVQVGYGRLTEDTLGELGGAGGRDRLTGGWHGNACVTDCPTASPNHTLYLTEITIQQASPRCLVHRLGRHGM